LKKRPGWLTVLLEVYRISWLRAKAKKERWEEECILLRSEMEWVPNYFLKKADEWKDLADGCSHDKQAFAFAKSEMWQLLHRQARSAFHAYQDLDG